MTLLMPVTSFKAALPPKISIEAIRKLQESAINVNKRCAYLPNLTLMTSK